MKALSLNKLSRQSLNKLDRPVSTQKQLDALLMKYSKVGLTNTRVYLKESKEVQLSEYLRKNGYRVFLEYGSQGPFAEVEW